VQINVAQLYDDNREKARTRLDRRKGRRRDSALARQHRRRGARRPSQSIHPNRIQVLGNHEIAHLAAFEEAELFQMLGNLFAVNPVAIVIAKERRQTCVCSRRPRPRGRRCSPPACPVRKSSSVCVAISAKRSPETMQRHGVCMDVLGLGVLITGDSGAGKASSHWN